MTTLKGIGIVACAFGVIYILRALPFLLMSRSAGDGKFFKAAEKWLSPIIIALLVVYCYSTLEWKTCLPYIAGALTVGMQLLLRNGLVSIFSGTALYMILVRIFQ